MSRRKLRIYGDEDLDAKLEEWLRVHKWVNYVGARDLGFQNRGDDHHYQEAYKRHRVLASHDPDYLDDTLFPLQKTEGVIVIKRGQTPQDVAVALEFFMRWAWGPFIRDYMDRGVLGFQKVRLSTGGFHYRMRTGEGGEVEDYFPF
jgi:predicted nuclease of predicted toxin-antitoxin system